MILLLVLIMALPELNDSGVPRDSSAELARLFKTASKVLRRGVTEPLGRTPSAQAFNQGRAAQLSDQVDRVLLELKARVRPWAGGAAERAVREGRATANRQAIDAGVVRDGEIVQGSFAVIDVGTVNAFARQITADLDKAADSMGQTTKRVIRQTAQQGLSEVEINRVLAGGVIQGRPVETIRQLRKDLEAVHGGTVRIVSRNGNPIEFDTGYYAEMVARTQTRAATVVARHERLAELDLDLVAIVGRVSQNFCTAFLGRVFSLSGRHPKYPAYDSLPGGGPPFHPNCTKSTRPFVEELASDRQLAQAESGVDDFKLLGMTTGNAQKAFKDLQIYTQVRERYKTTEKALFG